MMKAPVRPEVLQAPKMIRGVDGVLYAGVDAHRTAAHITIMDGTGKVLMRKRVSSSRDGLRSIFANYNEPIKAVVEATYNWGPMYDWLDEVADEVILAHPTKVRAIAEARIKSDTIDSETLAHLLRADLIPAAYAPRRRPEQSNGSSGSACSSYESRRCEKSDPRAPYHQPSVVAITTAEPADGPLRVSRRISDACVEPTWRLLFPCIPRGWALAPGLLNVTEED
jgi:hypothetical protein